MDHKHELELIHVPLIPTIKERYNPENNTVPLSPAARVSRLIRLASRASEEIESLRGREHQAAISLLRRVVAGWNLEILI